MVAGASLCGAGDVKITSVSSDEPANASRGGDGATQDDIVIAPDCDSVQLRAERDGHKNGRVYTITLSASGASALFQVTVLIGPGAGPAVDDGPAYTVAGCTP